MPPIFYFCDPRFTTPLMTHIHDSLFTTPITTPFSRLTFATPLATHISNSRSRLMFAITQFPSWDSTTDGRTVLTPQCRLPSFPTLTLTKKFWNLLPGLASTPSYYPPSCPPPLVALCLLTHPLAHYLLQRPLPPLPGPLPTSPPPSPPLPLPPSRNMSLKF